MILSKGTRGSEVRKLQKALKFLGFLDGAVDGLYGDGTETAVRGYQKFMGLSVDGVVGPRTLGAINKAATKEADPYEGELFTAEKLTIAAKRCPANNFQDLLPHLNKLSPLYGIDTVDKANHFIAQVGHESHFRIIEESLHYSPARMQTVFGRRGKRKKLYNEPQRYARNAKALGSYVYASRMGNGPESTGDGYKYRGRGLIQLTGKNNYNAFTADYNKRYPQDKRDFVEHPELLLEPRYAIESALSWWANNNVNRLVETGAEDIVLAVTKRVNGGTNGLADRREIYAGLQTV